MKPIRDTVRSARARSGADGAWVVHDGDVIFSERDTGRQMFIVAAGTVRITVGHGEAEVTLGVIERGDFFGEMALLEALPRSANAYAVGETHLLVIEPGALLLRIRRDPTFAIEMLHRLSGRLRQSNLSHLAALDHDPDEDDHGAEPHEPVWEIGPERAARPFDAP